MTTAATASQNCTLTLLVDYADSVYLGSNGTHTATLDLNSHTAPKVYAMSTSTMVDNQDGTYTFTKKP